MKQNFFYVVFVFACISIIVTSCIFTRYSRALLNENTGIDVKEKPNTISYAAVTPQQIPSFTDRASQSRGLLLGAAVSLATNAVKKLIARDRARYVANYTFAVTDLYFYDQLSLESVFDPVGMQFNGFTLVRTFTNSRQQTDTAFIARFELDLSAPNEIINNSIFRLKLIDFQLRYSKIKMTRAQKNNINMDVEITFNSSYVNEQGQLFDNMELGKFFLLLREAPMDKNSPAYAHYYDSLKGTNVEGRSFIVPRSFGYYKNENGAVGKSFSQGAYSISAKVTESANDRFVTKVLADHSSQIIDIIGRRAKSAVTN